MHCPYCRSPEVFLKNDFAPARHRCGTYYNDGWVRTNACRDSERRKMHAAVKRAQEKAKE